MITLPTTAIGRGSNFKRSSDVLNMTRLFCMDMYSITELFDFGPRTGTMNDAFEFIRPITGKQIQQKTLSCPDKAGAQGIAGQQQTQIGRQYFNVANRM